jgi:hypothetical protein
MTAYDTVDGLIPLTSPTVSSSNAQVAVAMAAPLPCTGAVYTVRTRVHSDQHGHSLIVVL